MSQVPHVFISSTCFDLAQVREDLDEALRGMGCMAIRSELASFPVDNSIDTVENCRRAIEREADAFVLIVGTRYGHVPADSEKSITNIEYLAARAKGIPIFVFIDRKLLDIAPVYEKNQGGDFSGQVDNTAVFAFVKQIREVDGVWTHTYARAQDIIEVLRAQFAFRLREAFRLFTHLQSREHNWTGSLSVQAFRLATEQPKAWEDLLFAQALSDAISGHWLLRQRYSARLAYGKPHIRTGLELFGYLNEMLEENMRLAAIASSLMNEELQKARGAPGEPGDARYLVFVARELAEVYKQSLLWAQNIRLADRIEGAGELIDVLASFTDCIVQPLEEFGPRVVREITRGLEIGTRENPIVLNLTLTFGTPPSDRLTLLLNEFGRSLGLA